MDVLFLITFVFPEMQDPGRFILMRLYGEEMCEVSSFHRSGFLGFKIQELIIHLYYEYQLVLTWLGGARTYEWKYMKFSHNYFP